MNNLQFEIKRLSKNLAAPDQYVDGLIEDGVDIEGLSEAQTAVYWWAASHFGIAHNINSLIYPQKKHLIQSLTWCKDFYPEQLPLFCFSFRSFLETSAHFINACVELEKNFDEYETRLENKELKIIINGEGLSERWSEYIKEKFYNPASTHALPTSINWEKAGVLHDNTPLTTPKNHALSQLMPDRIGGKLKKLETYISGLRPAYDLLSEIIHPNSSPLTRYSHRVSVKEFSNPVVVFKLEEGDPPDFHSAFVDLERVCNDCVTLVLDHENRVKKIQRTLLSHIKMGVRPFFRSLKILDRETLNYPCMCNSGKKFRKCCGK